MENNQSLDINKAFKFYFQDKDWLNKTLIGGLLVLSIIGNFAVMGWALHIQRREIHGEEPPVPGWNKMGEYFVLGFKYFLVTLTWNFPQIILLTVNNIYALKLWHQMQTANASIELETFPWFFFAQPLLWLATAYAFFALGIGSGLLAENFLLKEGFNFRRGIKLMRLSWKHFLGAGFLGWAAGYFAGLLGVAMLLIGVAFLSVPALAIRQNLYGQAFRVARDRLAEQSVDPAT